MEIDGKKPRIAYGVFITPNASIIGDAGLKGHISTHLLGTDPFMALTKGMLRYDEFNNQK